MKVCRIGVSCSVNSAELAESTLVLESISAEYLFLAQRRNVAGLTVCLVQCCMLAATPLHLKELCACLMNVAVFFSM